jgi:hypothetical protein
MIYKILYYLLLLIPNDLKQIMHEDKTDRVHTIIKRFIEGTDERKYIIHDIPGIPDIPDSHSIYISDNRDSFYNEVENNRIILAKIKNNIISKTILEELENPNTNIHYKLELVEKYTNIFANNKIHGVNLFAGDLYRNFDDKMDNI